MKIGILTYYGGANAGTFLQAYGMLQAFNRRFPQDQVELIDFSYPKSMFPESKDTSTFARWRSLWGRLRIGRERNKKYRTSEKELLVFGKARLMTDDLETALDFIEDGHYDLIVVGSDTILEMPKSRCVKGEPSVYWLPKRMRGAKVACSASVGTTRFDDLSPGIRQQMKEAIHDFQLVGVRDSLSWNIMQAFDVSTDKLHRVPDPTFAITVDGDYFSEVADENGIDLSRPLVGIDLHEHLPLCRELIRHYRDQGFIVISPRYNRHADFSLALSPFEWASMFKYLSLYITCMFHGTVFSLKNGVPIIAIEYDERRFDCRRESKITCLLRDYDLCHERHFILQNGNNFDEIFRRATSTTLTWNKELVLEKNNRLRDDFNCFLQQVTLNDQPQLS